MGVFKDGKDGSGKAPAQEGLDAAVLAAIDRAGTDLVAKLAKVIGSRRTGDGGDREIEKEDDSETMRNLAKVASANSKVEGSNFSKLGEDKAVVPSTDIDEAMRAIEEVE